jgi:alkyl hydroperoxide reductase subunit AhpC
MLNRKCKTSFKFILKGKKLNNISKAAFIVEPSTRAVYKVRGLFIINNFKIIYYKVYYLTCLITL